MVVALLAPTLGAAEDQTVFSDSLQNGWQNWSWAQVATVASPAHGGSASWSVTADEWEAAYFHSDAVDATLYTNLSFWIHGGTAGGQLLLARGAAQILAKRRTECPLFLSW